jgi:hypothetical protein
MSTSKELGKQVDSAKEANIDSNKVVLFNEQY